MQYLIVMAALIGQPTVPSGEPPYVPHFDPPTVPGIVKQALPAEPVRSAYAEAYAKAVREGKRLAAFVEAPSREIDGVVTIAVKWEGGFREYPRGSVVVATANPSNANELISLGHLDPNVSDEEIRSGGKKAVQPSARPFLGSNKAEQRPLTADDDARYAVAWQQQFPFLATAHPYKPARFTQEIAVTNGADRISPIPRKRTETIWHQPGGLEGVQGWRSDLYKYVPNSQKFVGNIAVWNGSNFQNNRGYLRRYAPGTFFADVLSNVDTGQPFEVRVAEKREDGSWERYIAFKDKSSRPADYHGLRHTCAACHDKFPGQGNYAGPLVPGSDGIFSDPFPELEAGTSLASAQSLQEFSNVPFSQPLQPSFSPGRGRLRR